MIEERNDSALDIPPYQYEHIDLPEVVKNPERFIIPGCLEACYELWNKNIETFMCSNL